MRVIRRELLVHPTQIENGIDLSNQMIWRHYLVQIKRIKELTLPDLPPPHHEPPPSESPLQATESRASDSLNESFATHSPRKRTLGLSREMSALCQKRTFMALFDHILTHRMEISGQLRQIRCRDS